MFAIQKVTQKSVILAITFSLTLTDIGCSKTVDKTGTLAQANAQLLLEPVPSVWTDIPAVEDGHEAAPEAPNAPELSVTSPDGLCGDPIGAMTSAPMTMEELTGQAWGFYDLVDFKVYAVATLTSNGSMRQGLSHIQGDEMGIETVCQNMEQLPQGQFLWLANVPRSISAVDGEIDEEISMREIVVGSESRSAPQQDSVTRSAKCNNLGKMNDPQGTGLAAPGCEAVSVYRTGANEISILKVSQKVDPQGNTIWVKSLSKYDLWGERTTPPAKPTPVPQQAVPQQQIPVQQSVPMQQALSIQKK